MLVVQRVFRAKRTDLHEKYDYPMTQRLPLLTPREEEELLRDAGFVDVELFYAAFSFRGWVGTKG